MLLGLLLNQELPSRASTDVEIGWVFCGFCRFGLMVSTFHGREVVALGTFSVWNSLHLTALTGTNCYRLSWILIIYD